MSGLFRFGGVLLSEAPIGISATSCRHETAIIEVEQLSKCYRIAPAGPYLSLRDELVKKTRRITSAAFPSLVQGQASH